MKSSHKIKIATRSSPLALWQANDVKHRLKMLGHSSELILIESSGDVNLTQPIYAMGISGVFTKQLDVALINNQADLAVHSLKDVPTELAENLSLIATLERGAHEDVVIVKDKSLLENKFSEATIATSSLRRRSQWLAKFPNHKTVPVRGNVQTRLKKFFESEEMDAIIFAKAGLERLNLLPENSVTLNWMLPAPAQGIVGIICREDDEEIKTICKKINHEESFISGFAERQFLKTLMGGCSVPISALVKINGDQLNFHGAMHSYDGKRFFEVKEKLPISEYKTVGKICAEKILKQKGAEELIEEIRNASTPHPFSKGEGEKSPSPLESDLG